jgi:hypothetical protein
MSLGDEKRRFAEIACGKTHSSGRVDRSLVHQHIRNVIADRIDAPALITLEDFRVHFQHQRFLADRTNQNI